MAFIKRKTDKSLPAITILVISVAVLCLITGCQPKHAASVETQPLNEPQPQITVDTNQPTDDPQKVELPKSEELQTQQNSEPNEIATVAVVPDPQPPITEPNSQSSAVSPKPESENTTPAALAAINKDYGYLLKNFVNEKGLVNYRKLRQKKSRLWSVLDKMSKLEVEEYASWTIEDQTAFWINVYNANMLDIILKNYPIEPTRIKLIFWPANDIRHIQPEPWTKKFLVMDEEFTLNEIDKRIFREEIRNPMVFLATCQAHISSPPLLNEPYDGSRLSEQLHAQVKKFLARPTAFKIDRQNHVVSLSNILSPTWYGNDFIESYSTDKKFKSQPPSVQAVLNFISAYISPANKNYLETEDYSIKYIRHDWVLNEQ